MKKLILATLFCALAIYFLFAQEIRHRTITVTLDNGNDTAYVWEPFYDIALSATKKSSSDRIKFLDMTAYIYIDSVKATQPTLDSLLWAIIRTDQDGNELGDTLFARLSNNDVVSSETWNSWTLSNRSSINMENMWLDLRGEFENIAGIKHIFILRDYGVDDSLQVKYHSFRLEGAR